MNVTLGCDVEEDGLVLFGSVVVVSSKVLLFGFGFLFLGMLLHVGNEALGCPFNLAGIQLVGRARLCRNKRRICALLVLGRGLDEGL